MIEAEKLTMHYGSVVALREAGFRVDAGEILGLLGPNGAGKSTIMRILTTYLYPTGGTARIGGKDVCTEPIDVRRMIGYMPEVLPLYIEMEVAEYLSFVGRARGLGGGALRTRTDWVLERTGLRAMYRRPIRELSKGYKQRTALAQALIHDPDVIILDEPTSGLDPHQILEIRKLIKELAENKTVIFSTHILQEVEAIADRVVIINRGEIVADGTARELAQRAQAGIRAELLVKADGPAGAGRDVERELEAIKSVEKASEIGVEDGWRRLELQGPAQAVRAICADVYRLARDRGWELAELKLKPFTIEETFLALTESESAFVAKGGAA